MLARPAHGLLHVRQRLAEGGRLRLDRIEARVEENPGGVVAGSAALNDVPAQRAVELPEDAAGRCGGGERVGERNRAERQSGAAADELPARQVSQRAESS